jgi:hypothetical protein
MEMNFRLAKKLILAIDKGSGWEHAIPNVTKRTLEGEFEFFKFI